MPKASMLASGDEANEMRKDLVGKLREFVKRVLLEGSGKLSMMG